MAGKQRKAKPEDYYWCEECAVVVAKTLAVVEEDVMTQSGPLCPKCKGELVEFKEKS